MSQPSYHWIFVSLVCLLNAWNPSSLCAQFPYRFLTADSSKGRAVIINEQGGVEWETKIGPLHDLHMLDNGNVLLQKDWTNIVEIEPSSNRVVWQYDSSKANGNEGKRIEVHAFQRLANGLTMIVESGVSRIIEVDAQGKIVHQVALKVSKPDAHRDTRLVRKLPSGNYLVCHEGDAVVREYAPNGETVWEYAVPLFDRKPAPGHGVEAFGNQCFSGLRLEGGNTLIATGNGHSVLEVNREGKIVWQLHQNDLKGVQLAWVTTLQVLPNGNIVIGNCHAGPNNPQILIVDRQKQIVASYRNFDLLGDATTNTQILSQAGRKIVAVAGKDR